MMYMGEVVLGGDGATGPKDQVVPGYRAPEIYGQALESTRSTYNFDAENYAMRRAWEKHLDAVYAATGKRFDLPTDVDPTAAGRAEFSAPYRDYWRRHLLRNRSSYEGQTDESRKAFEGNVERYEPKRGMTQDELRAEFRKMIEQDPSLEPILKPDADFKFLADKYQIAQEMKLDQMLRDYGPGYFGWASMMAGGMAAQFYDPVQLATMMIGPGGVAGPKTIGLLKMAMKQAAANAGVEALMQPYVQLGIRRDTGLDYGLGSAAHDIALAGLAGGTFDLAARVGARIGKWAIEKHTGYRFRGPHPSDQPPEMLKANQKKFEEAVDRGNLDEIKRVARETGFDRVEGVRANIDASVQEQAANDALKYLSRLTNIDEINAKIRLADNIEALETGQGVVPGMPVRSADKVDIGEISGRGVRITKEKIGGDVELIDTPVKVHGVEGQNIIHVDANGKSRRITSTTNPDAETIVLSSEWSLREARAFAAYNALRHGDISPVEAARELRGQSMFGNDGTAANGHGDVVSDLLRIPEEYFDDITRMFDLDTAAKIGRNVDGITSFGDLIDDLRAVDDPSSALTDVIIDHHAHSRDRIEKIANQLAGVEPRKDRHGIDDPTGDEAVEAARQARETVTPRVNDNPDGEFYSISRIMQAEPTPFVSPYDDMRGFGSFDRTIDNHTFEYRQRVAQKRAGQAEMASVDQIKKELRTSGSVAVSHHAIDVVREVVYKLGHLFEGARVSVVGDIRHDRGSDSVSFGLIDNVSSGSNINRRVDVPLRHAFSRNVFVSRDGRNVLISAFGIGEDIGDRLGVQIANAVVQSRHIQGKLGSEAVATALDHAKRLKVMERKIGPYYRELGQTIPDHLWDKTLNDFYRGQGATPEDLDRIAIGHLVEDFAGGRLPKDEVVDVGSAIEPLLPKRQEGDDFYAIRDMIAADDVDDLGFYSTLLRKVREVPQERWGSANDFLNWVSKQDGIKEWELDDLDLKAHFHGRNGKIEKSDVISVIQRKQLRLEMRYYKTPENIIHSDRAFADDLREGAEFMSPTPEIERELKEFADTLEYDFNPEDPRGALTEIEQYGVGHLDLSYEAKDTLHEIMGRIRESEPLLSDRRWIDKPIYQKMGYGENERVFYYDGDNITYEERIYTVVRRQGTIDVFENPEKPGHFSATVDGEILEDFKDIYREVPKGQIDRVRQEIFNEARASLVRDPAHPYEEQHWTMGSNKTYGAAFHNRISLQRFREKNGKEHSVYLLGELQSQHYKDIYDSQISLYGTMMFGQSDKTKLSASQKADIAERIEADRKAGTEMFGYRDDATVQRLRGMRDEAIREKLKAEEEYDLAFEKSGETKYYGPYGPMPDSLRKEGIDEYAYESLKRILKSTVSQVARGEYDGSVLKALNIKTDADYEIRKRVNKSAEYDQIVAPHISALREVIENSTSLHGDEFKMAREALLDATERRVPFSDALWERLSDRDDVDEKYDIIYSAIASEKKAQKAFSAMDDAYDMMKKAAYGTPGTRNLKDYLDSIDPGLIKKIADSIQKIIPVEQAKVRSRKLDDLYLDATNAPPFEPLVMSNDYWVPTAIKAALIDAVEKGAGWIALPSGKSVHGLRMGGSYDGLSRYYDQIYPQHMRKTLRQFDKKARDGFPVDHLLAHSDPRKRIGTANDDGVAFRLYQITDKMKEKILGEGVSYPRLSDSPESAAPRWSLDHDSDGMTPRAAAQRQIIIDEIKALAEKRLPSGVRLEFTRRVSANIEAGKTMDAVAQIGRTAYDTLIKIGMNHTDPGRLYKHEEIHVLRRLGLFQDHEWSRLAGEVKRRDLMKEYGIEDKYRKLYAERYGDDQEKINDALVEEAVARMMEERRRGISFGAYVDGIIDRILLFLGDIKEAMLGKGFTTIGDVYRRIESGRVGKRGDVRIEASSSEFFPAFAGTKALDAPKLKLDEARRMHSEGGTEEDIWRATGWALGADGRWRFEIDDSQVRFRQDMVAITEGQSYGLGKGDPYFVIKMDPNTRQYRRLGDVLEAEDLFRNYPELRDVRIIIDKDRGYGGGRFEPDTNRIVIDGARSEKEALRTLVHEVQHWIQHFEDFAFGASIDTLNRRLEIALFEIDYQLDNLRPGSNMRGELERLREKTQAQIDKFGGSNILAVPEDALDAYRAVIGEVEARNVELRRKFTAEERRAKPPSTTEDTPREGQFDAFKYTFLDTPDMEVIGSKIDDGMSKYEFKSKNPGRVPGISLNPSYRGDNNPRAPRNKRGNVLDSMDFSAEGVKKAVGRYGLDEVMHVLDQHLEYRETGPLFEVQRTIKSSGFLGGYRPGRKEKYWKTIDERFKGSSLEEINIEGEMYGWVWDPTKPEVMAFMAKNREANDYKAISIIRSILADIADNHPNLRGKPGMRPTNADPENIVDSYIGKAYTADDAEALKVRVVEEARKQIGKEFSYGDGEKYTFDENAFDNFAGDIDYHGHHLLSEYESLVEAIDKDAPGLTKEYKMAERYLRYEALKAGFSMRSVLSHTDIEKVRDIQAEPENAEKASKNAEFMEACVRK